MASETMPPSGELSMEEYRAMRHESRAANTFKNFLKELCAMGDLDEPFAERAAVAVLGLLEQRIFGEEVRDLEAQLPFKLRELLAAVPHHEGKPELKFGLEEFLTRIAGELKVDRDDVEPIVRAVFMAVRAQVSEGEADDVAAQLPTDLAGLWMLPG